jgi:hypothetical protein
MRIGDDKCYLRIERSSAEPWYAPVRLEARLVLDRTAEFFGVNTMAVVSAGDDDRAAFTEFEEHRSQRVVIRASDEGSLELRRDLHGNIDVLFSIGYERNAPLWRVTGDVRVEGEHTLTFLEEFRRVVFREG